jgi:hypothetical protein
MKDRGGGEGGGGRGGRGGRGGGHKVKSRAALSLTAFAGAKKSGYDKLRAQQTQFNLNAKKVRRVPRCNARNERLICEAASAAGEGRGLGTWVSGSGSGQRACR